MHFDQNRDDTLQTAPAIVTENHFAESAWL